MCRRLVSSKFVALSTYIESENKAHTYLAAIYVSAIIKLTEKNFAGKNGIQRFANKGEGVSRRRW